MSHACCFNFFLLLLLLCVSLCLSLQVPCADAVAPADAADEAAAVGREACYASWAAFKLCHSAAQLTTLSTTTNKQAAAVLEDTTTMLLTEYHPILPKRARILKKEARGALNCRDFDTSDIKQKIL